MKLTIDNLEENKSVFFLLPLILIPRTYFNKARAVYALSEHYPELDKHVFVLFSKDEMECHEVSRFQMFNTYHDHLYIGEFVMFIFTIPVDFQKDHKKFLKGKYSKFSEKAKNAIGNHYAFRVKNENGKLEDSKIFKILNPLKEDRVKLATLLGVELEENCEILSVPDLDQEKFNINKFYKIFE